MMVEYPEHLTLTAPVNTIGLSSSLGENAIWKPSRSVAAL